RWLRSRWNALPAPTAGGLQGAVRSLVADVQRLSRELCPQETPAIVANAGNGPVEHLARRRRTAATRDTFATPTLTAHRTTLEYRSVSDQSSLKLVIQLAQPGEAKAEGRVIVKAGFTTNAATTNNRRKWSLRELLASHAPEQLEKLKFGTHPSGTK